MISSKKILGAPAHSPQHKGWFSLKGFLLAGIAGVALLNSGTALALNYPYAPYNEGKMDPQLTGWPLTPEELNFIGKASYMRRPGNESGSQKMAFLPYTPSAEGTGKPSWYVGVQDQFIKVVDQYKRDNGNNVDILLVGDSITWQWIDIRASYTQYPQKFNAAWTSSFGQYKALNLGVAGDKTQGVLWRLDHGATQGSSGPEIKPRLVILAIGHNNMFFSRETGIQNAALGIVWCVKNLRERFPDAQVIVSKILPNTNPTAPFYIDAKAINAELDTLLTAEKDPKVHVLPDMWNDMVNPDGTVIDKYFRSEEPAGKKIHLSPTDGYELWASKLKPLVDSLLNTKPANEGTK
jgi:platelet-activating factor acetylhydrolase IB subunit beta/gamma